MRTGKVPRSMELPAGELVPSFAPDGLTEPVIDALIAEAWSGVEPVRRRPGWLSVDVVESRRSRRVARLAVRSLTSLPRPAAGIELGEVA